MKPLWKFAAARPDAAAGSPSCFPTWPSTSTTCASSTRCTPKGSPTARRRCFCTAARPTSFAPRWARGSPTAWAPRTKTCPASFRSALRPAMAARATTATPSCRPSIKARRWARPALRPAKATIRNLRIRIARPDEQRRQFDLLQDLNAEQLARRPGDSELEAVINSFELAWRMQSHAPEVLDLSRRNARDAGPLRHRRARRPTTLAGSACWPAGCARRACATSR